MARPDLKSTRPSSVSATLWKDIGAKLKEQVELEVASKRAEIERKISALKVSTLT